MYNIRSTFSRSQFSNLSARYGRIAASFVPSSSRLRRVYLILGEPRAKRHPLHKPAQQARFSASGRRWDASVGEGFLLCGCVVLDPPKSRRRSGRTLCRAVQDSWIMAVQIRRPRASWKLGVCGQCARSRNHSYFAERTSRRRSRPDEYRDSGS